MPGLVHGALESWSSVWFQACGCSQATAVGQGCGAREEAAFVVRPLGEGAPCEASRATHEGALLLREGLTEEAVRVLQGAMALVPRSPEACSNLGCACEANGDVGSALFWYKEALGLSPHDEAVVLALAILQQERGDHDEARRLLRQYLQETCQTCEQAFDKCDQWPASVRPLLRSLQRELAKQEWWAAASAPDRPPSLALEQVRGASDEARREVVLCEARADPEAVELDPVVPSAPSPPHQRPLAAGGEDEAAEACHAAGGRARSPPAARAAAVPPREREPSAGSPPPRLRAAPAPPPHPLLEARRLLEGGSPAAAGSIFEGILQVEPDSAEALLGLVDCQEALGGADAALETGMRLLELQPESGEANLRVAELLLAAGHGAAMAAPYLKQVDASLREAGEVASFSDERSLKFRACCAAAEVAMADEEHAAALAAAQEAVRLDASAPRGLVLLGRARLHVADYSAALRAFAAALAAAADAGDRRCQATVHALTAQARERLRQHAEALEEARSALAVEPGHVLARVVLATVLQQSGSLQEAERELQQALDCHPCDPGAQLQLGYCQLLGGRAEAISTLEELLRREGAPRSVLGAARVYLALALDAHQPPGHERSVEALLGEALGLHRNLARVWRDAEAGDADQAAAAVQRLRGICDLDLNTLQARQLLRLLALRAGRADLARALAAAHAQQARGAAHGARSRCPSSNPPSRWSCPEGPLLSLAASGASTPLLAGRGSPVPTGGPPTPQAAWPRSPSQPLGQGAPPHEASRRGRSREPQVWHRGSPVDASAARAPSLAGWRASREHSRERPTAASEGGDVLTIGWNELIHQEELLVGPLLGSGSSAQVYRGSWRGREVAIKQISGVAHLEELQKEICVLRRLRHPRLVQLLGVCLQPPLLVVVTELVAAGSLYDRLFGRAPGPPLTPPQRRAIGCHVAEGVEFLHSQRVVHRDLKSTNILLGAQGAKICDLGLAQQMGVASTRIARRIDGEGGSPRYMAPECWDAALGSLTEKMDIWSMGCVLLELHGEQLPYANCTSMVQLSAMILVEKRPPAIPESVPQCLAALIRSCCAFDQNCRPTAVELLCELSRQAGG